MIVAHRICSGPSMSTSFANTKTVELRNGLCHGRRVQAHPEGTFMLVPYQVHGMISLYDYRNSGSFTQEGLEIWLWEPWSPDVGSCLQQDVPSDVKAETASSSD